MGFRFRPSRKALLLNQRIKREKRKRLIILSLLFLIILTPAVMILKSCLESVHRLPPADATDTLASFDARIIHEKAWVLIEEGKVNEFRGRRHLVREKFVAALKLLEELREKAPAYKRDRVLKDKLYLEEKLRKMK